MFFNSIISQSWMMIAILFFSTFTPITIKARFNNATNTTNFSYLDFSNSFSYFENFSKNFMTSYKRIYSSSHFTSSYVAVIVTYSTIQNFKFNLMWSYLGSIDKYWRNFLSMFRNSPSNIFVF